MGDPPSEQDPISAANSRSMVCAAQAGDAAALDAIVRQHLPALRAFVRLRADVAFRARESGSDLVQTAMRHALEHLGEFEWRGENSFRNWLFAVAANKLLNRRQYHRAARRDPARERLAACSVEELSAVYGSIATPSENAVAAEWVERFEEKMARLPEKYREVVLQSRILGLSHSEIAGQLGTTEAAVRTRLSRALARLMTLMDEVGG